MATVSSLLTSKLEQIGLAGRSGDYLPVFHGEIDMPGSTELHGDVFAELLQYIESYIAEFIVELPNSTSRWVPLDYLKHLYKSDKNFRFRLNRFCNVLTRKSFRVENLDVVEDLGLGNIGTSFLSLDMTFALMLSEQGPDKGKKSKKPKASTNEVPLVQEKKVEGVNLSEQAKASMALMLLQTGDTENEDDRMLEPEEVADAIRDIDVSTLNPILVDGKEFLFLDDISKSLGLREDETLSALATATSMLDEGETFATAPTLAIDFDDHDLTKSLEYMSYNAERKLEENVAAALVAIQEAAGEHDLPDSAFQPAALWQSTKTDNSGSIPIDDTDLVEADDIVETAFTIDRYATRGGSVWVSAEGRDSSLWHYIKNIDPSILRVFHTEYSEEAHEELLKCKALSGILCEDALASNANKCILVSREATLWAFVGNYPHGLLGRCALSLAQGIDSPQAIASNLQNKSIEGRSAMSDLLKNM